MLENFEIQLRHREPEVFPDSEDILKVDKILSEIGHNHSSDCVAIAPGSVWPTKRWPQESFVNLCKLLSEQEKIAFLIGGSDDQRLCFDIAAAVATNVFNLAGQLTWRQSAELLKRCSVVVTNDSAPTHLAAAVGTPTVAIFGPTVTGFGFYPLRLNSLVVEMNLPCRPCGIHGSKKCPIATHECMVGISVTEVMKAVDKVVTTR